MEVEEFPLLLWGIHEDLAGSVIKNSPRVVARSIIFVGLGYRFILIDFNFLMHALKLPVILLLDVTGASVEDFFIQ